jgi:hypothetical protein
MVRLLVGTLLAIALLPGCASPRQPDALSGFTLGRTFLLEGVGAPRQDVGVPGRLDHFAYDPDTRRLFVAALENGSLEVLDLDHGQRVQSLGGLGHPQGIAIARSVGCAVVACGSGDVYFYDTQTLQEIRKIALGPGADNVRYAAAADLLYVTHGNTDGGSIAVLDPHTGRTFREIPFKSRPESFQLDPTGPRLFANLPEGVRATQDGVVAFTDPGTGRLESELTLTGRARNFPMAYDAAHERLFVACRRPPRLVAIDARTHAVVAEAACTDDSDDLFCDAQTNRVYVIGGGFRRDLQDVPAGDGETPDETGAIDVFVVSPAGELALLTRTRTAPHARTGLFIPQRRALYVAVPPQDGRDAEIREYLLAD